MLALSKIDGDSAVVTIKQDGGNQPGVTEYDLVRVGGAWKLEVNKEKQAKRDVESKVEEKLVKGGKEAAAAEAVVVACIDFAKKGLLNKESAPKFFSCSGDNLDQVLPMFDLFNYKSDPDYKKLSKQVQEEAAKEVARFGVTSSSFSTVGGYAVVGIGDKSKPDEEITKFKVVNDNGKWKIAGIYLEFAETQKRVDSLNE